MTRVLPTVGGLLALTVALGPTPVASAQPAKQSLIEAAGMLVPSDLQPIYTPIPGVIRVVHCKSGEEVRKGQTIVTLVSREAEVEDAKLTSEISAGKVTSETLAGQLPKVNGEEERRVKIELVVAQERVKAATKALGDLRRIYNGGELKSPSDGTVISDAPDQLIGKTVPQYAAEQVLPIFRVARLKGEWHADVRFAERDVGRLLVFLGEGEDSRAAVEVTVAAFPGKVFKGMLHRKDIAKEMTQREKDSVLHARVRLDEESLKDLRILPIGANVRIKVAVPEKQ